MSGPPMGGGAVVAKGVFYLLRTLCREGVTSRRPRRKRLAKPGLVGGFRAMTITVELVTAATPEVRTLIAELDADLAQHYSVEQRHGLSLDAIFQPHIRFFVAYRDGVAAGCGGVALMDSFGEVKRMYVRPDARGSGVADAIMARLEAETAASGRPVLKLETGVHQPAANRFYARVGFTPCPMFPPYSAMEPHTVVTSLFMEKRLG